MPGELYSQEYNETCGLRPQSIRNDAFVGESFIQFNYFMIAFVSSYYSIGVLAFWLAKRRASSSYIAKRNFLAVLFAALGAFGILAVGPIRDIYGRQRFNCAAMLWLRVLGVAFVVLPVSVRVVFFREQMLWSRAKKSISFQKLQEIIAAENNNSMAATARKSIFRVGPSSPIATPKSGDALPTNSTLDDDNRSELQSDVSESRKGLSSGASSIGEIDFERIKNRQSVCFKLALIILPSIPVFIMGIVYNTALPYYRTDCYGCYEEILFYLLTFGTVALLVSATGIVGFMVRNTPDPLGLLYEIKWLIIIATPIGSAGLLGLLMDEFVGRPYDRGIFSFDWIILFALIVEFGWLAYIPLIVAYRMNQRVAAAGARYDFASFLANPKAHKIFAEHLMNEWSIENLKFWDQVETYRSQHANLRKIRDANIIATQIFNTFVRPGAILDVNIPSQCRENLCKYFEDHGNEDPDFNTKAIPATVFDEARDEIFHLMEKDSFRRFQQTKTFKSFVAENTVLDAAKQKLVVVNPSTV